MDRQAEEGLADGADHVLELVLADDRLHRVALLRLADRVVGPGDEEAGRVDRLRVVGPEHVAGELQADELVVRQVGVERVDDPVAIGPGVRPRCLSSSKPSLSPKRTTSSQCRAQRSP